LPHQAYSRKGLQDEAKRRTVHILSRAKRSRRTHRFAATISALAIVFVGLSAAEAAESAVPCTNPASGATWQIKIDYAKSTVDSYPAKISDAKIAWHSDGDGGNYTLDRKTGKLTVVVPSSTGGYFLYDDCRLGP
jgi:hypothetical protein